MLIALEYLIFSMSLAKSSAVVLSNFIGLGGCGQPIYLQAVRRGIVCVPLQYAAPISASAANPITFSSIMER